MNKQTLFLLGLTFFAAAVGLWAQPTFGVLRYDTLRTGAEYRLLASRNLEAAHLLHPDGRYVHSWHYPYQRQPSAATSELGTSWHYAEMLPNGHLVALIKDEAILELDGNSRLVWEARLRAHHDFARDDRGRTLVLSRRSLSDPWEPGRTVDVDEVVELDERGKVRRRWRYEDHQQELEALLGRALPEHRGFRDWPHLNTLELLPDSPLGRRDRRFRQGNWLMCARHANVIFVVDQGSGKIVWAWGVDQLQGPHMPTLLENGHILVYDNGWHSDSLSRGYTRVLEIEPRNGEVVWEYGSPAGFYSPTRGSAHRLSNGNTLIADADNGHLIEVNAAGAPVWEYRNPDTQANGKPMALYRSVPYAPEGVEPLLAAWNSPADCLPEEDLEFRRMEGPSTQYKQLIREIVFYVEIGRLDKALFHTRQFMEVFGEDEEGYYALSLIYAARKDPARAFEYMKKSLAAGLPLDRFLAGPRGLFQALYAYPPFQDFAGEHTPPWVHGPLLGSVTEESARIWFRTRQAQTLRVKAYRPGHAGDTIYSPAVQSQATDDFTLRVALSHLQPATHYRYEVESEGRWWPGGVFRTFPAKGSGTRFLTGFGGGAGYTPMYERVWDTLGTHPLSFFLLLGDNVYIDHPERPATQLYCYYRRQSRPEFRRFSARNPIFAIWDDHDFTYNDGKGSPEVDTPYWKKEVWQRFKQQWNNPFYGGGEDQPGCWMQFSHGDVEFFMLDTRYYREQPKGNPGASMLGAAQKAWLKEALKASTATFKVIASSVPWAEGTKPGSLDTWDGHPEEREELFSFIEEERIEGVLLISADRHRSDAWRIHRPEGYDLFDLMSSKLSNMHTHRVMPGSLFGYNKTCSFGLLEFDTTREDPQVTYRIVNIENEEIHRMTLYRSQLTFKP